MTREEELTKENTALKEQIETLWKSKVLKMKPESVLWIKGAMPIHLARSLKEVMLRHGLYNMVILTPETVNLESLDEASLAQLGLQRRVE